MAFTTTVGQPGQSVLTRAFHAIAGGLVTYMERQSRQDQIQRLEAKSDAELAAMGISRDRIVSHVFRDRFYF
ncbi:hypothetical protein BMI90_17135 [Thioclava sp. L04-15]|jgi:hypothetical protein|uniref:hypothetical protein n=1 Tax=Thioclava sp. L04-15 TaxID=1915318 RepID=UPI0009972E2A|nr:hypothetical protein [Thioclava sp. L04-15]OOY26556.1 hypothetical protein BMI90_17135 [Thioclava sp. L04-15]TNE89695.1 MAG: hypothetical protein EP337_08825 [Paracoccaceae bacterium]